MAYLIIPILCFALIGGVAWLILKPVWERQRTGTITDLDAILSVLMTAEGDAASLVMKVPRRVTSMRLGIAKSRVDVELPIVTRLQRSRRARYQEMLSGLGLTADQSAAADGSESLRWRVTGSPLEASALIRSIFLELFEVDPDRRIEFHIRALTMDQGVIDEALQSVLPRDLADLPTAASEGRPEAAGDDARLGCLRFLAGLTLLPVPFVVAHLYFGVMAASAVLMAFVILRLAHRIWKDRRLTVDWRKSFSIVALLLPGATIASGDPVYLQVLPTTILLMVAVVELVALVGNRPPLLGEKTTIPGLTPTGRVLLSGAILVTCIAAAAVNEYLRAHISLDAWVWVFAFVRIELLLGFLLTSTPFMFHQIGKLTNQNGSAAR